MSDRQRNRVAVVFTGGTISMKFDPVAGGPVPALSGAEILCQVPGLEEIAEIQTVDFARLAGPHVTPRLMLDLAGDVIGLLADPALCGIVITHGTDTLEETAYLLDLVTRSDKPVVLVGAMRNSSELGWDGPANLRSAVRVAVDPAARGLGVLVVMNDQVLSASEAIKTHTESTSTFQARDFGALGFLDKDQLIIAQRPLHREYIATAHLEERVEIVKLSAGSDGRLVLRAIADGAHGLVIEGLGRGNIPVTAIPAVEQAAQAGIPIVITSRCPRGRVLDTYAYDGSGRHLKRLGIILGGLHSPHKARIKLMLLLGARADREAISRSFEPSAPTS